ncbi:MAG TPA: dephospho-CoA kinase [Candidatus Acidoferrales bacterium]|nr:dephospho-CoA kinase [Candidatus Acidoferrales bacterium]
MLRVGLTGGIASGKSTVAAMLRSRGCDVLEMDPIGHRFLEPGQPAYNEVLREFGRETLTSSGSIDRAKLAAVIFADPAKRVRLNAILHPRILDVVRKWFDALDRPGGPHFAVVEAALILEAGYHTELDRIIVCWCPPDQQLQRLERRGLSPEQAQARISAQMPMDDKRELADDVIDCSKSLSQTQQAVDNLIARLNQLAEVRGNIS